MVPESFRVVSKGFSGLQESSMGYQERFSGSGFHEVSGAFRDAPNGFKEDPEYSNGFQRHLVLLFYLNPQGFSRGYKDIRSCSSVFQKRFRFFGGFRCVLGIFRGVSGGFKDVPCGFKGFQGVRWVPRTFHGRSMGFQRRSRVLPWASEAFQGLTKDFGSVSGRFSSVRGGSGGVQWSSRDVPGCFSGFQGVSVERSKGFQGIIWAFQGLSRAFNSVSGASEAFQGCFRGLRDFKGRFVVFRRFPRFSRDARRCSSEFQERFRGFKGFSEAYKEVSMGFNGFQGCSLGFQGAQGLQRTFCCISAVSKGFQ